MPAKKKTANSQKVKKRQIGRKSRSKKSIPKPPSRKPSFPIVGLGASAGGLEALELFFSNLPSDTNLAFVIIQHLSPKHKSIMADLLMKYTQMKVLKIKDDQEIKPNCVYLNPPDKNVITLNRRLYLTAPTQTHGVNLPIDCFFRSLSEDSAKMPSVLFCLARQPTAR